MSPFTQADVIGRVMVTLDHLSTLSLYNRVDVSVHGTSSCPLSCPNAPALLSNEMDENTGFPGMSNSKGAKCFSVGNVVFPKRVGFCSFEPLSRSVELHLLELRMDQKFKFAEIISA